MNKNEALPQHANAQVDDRLLQQLNAEHGLGGALRFATGRGGLTMAAIAVETGGGTAIAEIYLHGAHVTAWQPPHTAQPVLFLSEKSQFAAGKAIRGGVPVIFPWFADRRGASGPAHGFARTSLWEVAATEQDAVSISITLRLRPDQGTRDLGFDHFALLYHVRVGATLELRLELENLGDAEMKIEDALHAYFTVSDVRQASVAGLQGTDYLDRADGAQRKHQDDALVRFDGETDQLHLSTVAPLTIADPAWRRRIEIEKHGSHSTVVWNPGVAKATALADLGGNAWPGMVCVEPANAVENEVTVPPGGRHTMGATVRVEQE